MEAIRQYAVSVLCAALVVGLLLGLTEKSAFHKQIKLVSSIFFLCVFLKPLLSIGLPEYALTGSGIFRQGEQASERGEEIYIQSLYEIIRRECEAYILKEAEALGAELEVLVELDSGNPPKPCSVTLRGSFDGAQEERLSRLLADEFGIPKEHQTWIRTPSGNSSENTSTFF